MKTHRTPACRLWLFAVCVAAALLFPAVTSAAAPSDWATRLAMATNVSHEGYADSSFVVRAQDSAIAMARAILSGITIENEADSVAQSAVLAEMGDYAFRKRDYSSAVTYWSRAGQYATSAASTIPLRLCLPVIAGHREALEQPLAGDSEALYTHLLQHCPGDSLRQLWTLAHLCENMWLMGEARLLHERVVAIQAQRPESDSRWAIRSLVTLGELTSKRVGIPHVTNPVALQDSAVSLAQRALELARVQFGPTDTMFAYVADRLGDYHSRLGHRTTAHALWDSAWTANRIHLPPEHIELQGNLDRMASVFRSQGRFLDAEALGRQALGLRKKTRGEGHPEVAYMYANLGRTYHATGKYQKAEDCYRAALRIREHAIERSDPLIAESYRQLGQLYLDDGRYALADRNFRRAIELMTEALGEHHSWVAACMRDLAAMCTTWGRPEEAIDVLTGALAIQIQFLGDSHPAIATTLEELARTELLLGHVGRAGDAIDQAIQVEAAALRAGGTSQGSLVTTKARVLLAAGYPAAAESLLTPPGDETGNRDLSMSSAEALTLLARAQSDQGRIHEAQSTYDRLFAPSSVLGDISTVSAANALDQYAQFLISRAEYDQALNVSVRSLKHRLDILNEGGQVLSEHEALQFEQAMHRSRDILLSALLSAREFGTDVSPDVSDLLLSSKGAISNSIFKRERGLREAETYEIAALRDSLHVTRHRLATLYVRGLGDAEANRYDQILDSLRETKGRLEQHLAQHLGTGTAVSRVETASADIVRLNLPPKATLIEYFRYRFAGNDGNDQYAALMIPDTGRIEVRNLGHASIIDSLMRVYEAQMAAVSQSGSLPGPDDLTAYRDIGSALYTRIWAPIASDLPRDCTVIIAPDAELYLLSFAGLPDSDGHFLIENRPVHYLSCGRSLLDKREERLSHGALMLCDPDFDADFKTRAPSDQVADQRVSDADASSDFVTLRSSCDLFSGRRFVRLPGTRDEVETVRVQLVELNLGAIDIRSGPEASEEYLKRHAEGRRLLHLATHGFYLSRNCGSEAARRINENFTSLVGENPLLLSGLCLAGANLSDDSAAAEDGILTAEEVACLPLDGTRWVVLSACETRLGETRHGEGVFGLQRAFQMAGASTVIGALWSIPDRATTSFMKSLYAHSKSALYDAMRQSQLAAIAELRKRGQPDHPYNWGAFVAVGGWSPLD